MSVVVVDFDDSFTFNISSELYEYGLDSEVIHWSKFQQYVSFLEDQKKRTVLILGPGPGHPDDYASIFPFLRKLLDLPHLFILGVCLGHQILLRLEGHQVKYSQTPVHGQQVALTVPVWFSFFPPSFCGKTISVQRYNSLYVCPKTRPQKSEMLLSNGEVMASSFKNVLTYQFHPESVGTSYRQYFFKPVLDFLV